MRTVLLCGVALAGACGSALDETSSPTESQPACAGDNGGIQLPDGFCASVFADDLGRARHIAVTPSGDVFVAIDPPLGEIAGGSVMALRDADHDGVAEVAERVLDIGGNGIAWADGSLYVAAADRIVRFELEDGTLTPERPLVVASELPVDGDHSRKTIVLSGDDLFVNIGSASNSCQVENRVLHSPGVDPCEELRSRAGIWKFAATRPDQCTTTGQRVATGVRNGNALGLDPHGRLWTAINGRDQLHENWPELFTVEQDLVRPSEEIGLVEQGDDYGWPYCYYDPFLAQKVLAPEYGGDGTTVGRCATAKPPAAILPAHWAPLALAFYDGAMFPEKYRAGMFVSNHGSRFDVNAVTDDPGYNVVFIPFIEGAIAGPHEDFATGFRGTELPLPDAAPYRPVGLAFLPDGSMLIGDDKVGRIWRVTYHADPIPDTHGHTDTASPKP